MSPMKQVKGNKKEMRIQPENIDMGYKDYYKNYNDGIDERTLDRYRFVLNKKHQERDLAA